MVIKLFNVSFLLPLSWGNMENIFFSLIFFNFAVKLPPIQILKDSLNNNELKTEVQITFHNFFSAFSKLQIGFSTFSKASNSHSNYKQRLGNSLVGTTLVSGH